MSDLLESVRAVNPVLSCEQPSMENVWRKLAQDEPRAGKGARRGRLIGAATQSRARRDGISRRATRSSGSWAGIALSGVVAAMAAAVILAVAASHTGGVRIGSAQPSAAVRRLAAGTISCDFTPAAAHGASVSARGRSAIVFCRKRYLAMEHGSTDASGVRLIACQTSATNVAVFISDGRPNQCGRRGDRALPAGYAAAVRDSGSATTAISNSKNASALSV